MSHDVLVKVLPRCIQLMIWHPLEYGLLFYIHNILMWAKFLKWSFLVSLICLWDCSCMKIAPTVGLQPLCWEPRVNKDSLFYTWSRSEYSLVCFACCWDFCLSGLCFHGSFGSPTPPIPAPTHHPLHSHINCVLSVTETASGFRLWLALIWPSKLTSHKISSV